MAIDRQADVVFTSSAWVVASTRLQQFGLESQDNRLGQGHRAELQLLHRSGEA